MVATTKSLQHRQLHPPAAIDDNNARAVRKHEDDFREKIDYPSKRAPNATRRSLMRRDCAGGGGKRGPRPQFVGEPAVADAESHATSIRE